MDQTHTSLYSLRASDRELADLVFDSSEAAIVICDIQGKVVLANSAAKEIASTEIVGTEFETAFPLIWLEQEGENKVRPRERFSLEPLRMGQSVRGLCAVSSGDPVNRRTLKVSASPYRGPKVKDLCCVITMIDVTGFEVAQQRLNAVVHGTTDAVFVKDAAGRYLMINSAGADVIGKTVDEILGKTAFDVFDRLTAERLQDDDEEVMQSGQVHNLENMIPTLEGPRIFHSVKAPYRDNVGNIIGTVGIARDVTQFRQAQSELARQAALLDLSPDAILVRAIDGGILFWSRGAMALYGWLPSEVLGKNSHELFQTEFLSTEESQRRALEMDGRWEGELIHVKRDGSRIRVASRQVVKADAGNANVEILEINEDITERKRIEEAQLLLAHATTEFTSTLEVDELLTRIAELAVPTLADWCAVHLLMQGGVIKRLGFAHHDPKMIERIARRPQQYSMDSSVKRLVPQVIRSGIPEFYADIVDTLFYESARDDAHLQTLKELGMESLMCIPLQARGRVLGAVTFVFSDSHRRYSQGEFELAQELVRRAGLAADNAMLYHESQAAQVRLRLVAEVSSELIGSMDYRTRMDILARLIVPRFADWCTINLKREDGTIELAAVSHADMEKVAVIREWVERQPIDVAATTGTPNVIRTGKPEWVFDTASVFESLEETPSKTYMRRLGIRSYLIVPLIARGRILGAVTFARSDSGRNFAFEDLLTAEEISRRAALALDNAALFKQEQEARQAAEEYALRVSALQNITAALAGAVEPWDVSQLALDQAMKALGANAGIVTQVREGGLEAELVQAAGYSAELIDAWRTFPLTMNTPSSRAIRERRVILVNGKPELEEYSDVLERRHELVGEAWAAIPLRLDTETIGSLSLTFPSERQFDADDVAFMTAIAQQTAQAMERARLYKSELDARKNAETAARRSEWLTEASHVLSGSLEVEETFKHLANLAVPYLADWCQIHLAKEDGTAEQLVLAHQDPEKLSWAEEYSEEIKKYFTPRWDAPIGLPNVLRTGKSEIYYDIPESLIDEIAETEMQRSILKGIGYSSVMIVPLNAKGRTLGAITLVNTDSRRHFTDDDLAFAELLAERAGAAIENARLFREKEALATELEKRVAQRTFELSEAYKELSVEVVERTRAEEMTRALLRMSSKLNSTLDVDTSLEILTQEAIRVTDGSGGFAGLRTPFGMQMRTFFANGKIIRMDHTWNAGRGIPSWVMEKRAPYVTNDAQNDPFMVHELPFNQTVKSILCTPILDAGGEVVGFFEIRDKSDGSPFTEADVEFMMAVSPIASIAIQNAMAYEKIRETEAAVKDSYAQLRALAARLQTIREEERADIARELHDELGQALTALKMDLAVLIAQMPKRSKQLHERAQIMTQQIDETIKTVRRLSSQLRPGMLDDLGLGPSLEWYGQEFQTRTGIRVEVVVPQEELMLDLARATAVFRIFQETLTNVARHSEANHVHATLEVLEDELVLRVHDNGKGFDQEQVRGKRSLGLLGMRERAENVQGTMEIQGAPGKGTLIIVKVPFGGAIK